MIILMAKSTPITIKKIPKPNNMLMIWTDASINHARISAVLFSFKPIRTEVRVVFGSSGFSISSIPCYRRYRDIIMTQFQAKRAAIISTSRKDFVVATLVALLAKRLKSLLQFRKLLIIDGSFPI
jgi:hypothetical protein